MFIRIPKIKSAISLDLLEQKKRFFLGIFLFLLNGAKINLLRNKKKRAERFLSCCFKKNQNTPTSFCKKKNWRRWLSCCDLSWVTQNSELNSELEAFHYSKKVLIIISYKWSNTWIYDHLILSLYVFLVQFLVPLIVPLLVPFIVPLIVL